MSDQLTAPPPPPLEAEAGPGFPWREQWRRLVGQAALIVVGIAGGFLVERLWDRPEGMVYQHQWRRGLVSLDPPTLAQNADQGVFDGVGWYVVVAIAVGLVLGAVAALFLARAELVTLAAVLVGACAAGVIMYAVARNVAPPDPAHLARTAAQGTVLPDTLRLGSPWIVLACPGGALASLAAVFLLTGRRSRPEAHPGAERAPRTRADAAG
jgi:hypothetical protein